MASETGACIVLKYGTLYCNALSNVVCPVLVNSSALNTSIGNGVLVEDRGSVRVPTTTNSFNNALKSSMVDSNTKSQVTISSFFRINFLD